ncbi:hypothetical protein O181_028260 [Austropuccinia psidii MF-1]|uniref:Uncharacterized protein n=1 Tax=Austropuccinia psidii MF-1 TaxID=1389203 RepID=A0A9Q3H409_9BASI|nr:hypothetical protein [Austropuccinia psidii MF-1]
MGLNSAKWRPDGSDLCILAGDLSRSICLLLFSTPRNNFRSGSLQWCERKLSARIYLSLTQMDMGIIWAVDQGARKRSTQS